MHRPKDVTQRLGISQTTLRRWATLFADHLSPTAGSALTETGNPGQRRYTDHDIALMAAIKRELDGGRSVGEVLVRLQRGDIRPDAAVVEHDNMPPGPETHHRALTEPPAGEALALVGGSSPADLQAALIALVRTAPTIGEALQQVEVTMRELRDVTAAQQATLTDQLALQQELRAEREALATERASLQELRDSPLVPNIDHGGPQAPVTWGQRLKRLFTGLP